jgi:HEPN domain-containing protein
MGFQRDATHWLRKYSPDEWVRLALAELRRAESSLKGHDRAAGLAGSRRAAGMALNGALLVEPNEGWGRSYVDHLRALERDTSIPEQVRQACGYLMEMRPPGADILTLHGPRSDERLLDAARDVMAHAYAVIKRHEGEGH